MKLFGKLFIPLIILTIIPVLVMGYWGFWSAKQSLEFEKLNDLMNTVDSKYIHILDVLFQTKKNVQALGEDEYIHHHLQEFYETREAEHLNLLSEYIAKMQKNSELFEHSQKNARDEDMAMEKVFNRDVKWNIYRLDETLYRFNEISITDEEGKVISSSSGDSLGMDLQGDEFFTRGREGVFIKDFFRDNNGETVVGFAAPILETKHLEGLSDAKKPFLGMIIIKMDVKFFNDILNQDLGNRLGGKLFLSGIDPAQDFYMVRKDGTMITQSLQLLGKENTILNKKIDTLPVRRCLDKNNPVREAQEKYVNYLGKEVNGASMCVFEMDWTIIGERETGLTYVNVANNMRSQYIIVILVLVLLMLAFSFIFVRSQTKPVLELEKIAKKVAAGDIKSRVEIKSKDEIGFFASIFNRMLDNLEKNQQEVEQAGTRLEETNEVLKKKVAELERFQALTVGRELKMMELKKEIAALREKSEPRSTS